MHHYLLVSGAQRELARQACLVDETALLQEDSILVIYSTRTLDLDSGCPEVITLAGQAKRFLLRPARNVRTGLHDAQLLAVHRAIIDLKCQIHRYVYVRFVFLKVRGIRNRYKVTNFF